MFENAQQEERQGTPWGILGGVAAFVTLLSGWFAWVVV
jgi:hypothetical protein